MGRGGALRTESQPYARKSGAGPGGLMADCPGWVFVDRLAGRSASPTYRRIAGLALCLGLGCASGGEGGAMSPFGASGPTVPNGSTSTGTTPVDGSTGGSTAAAGESTTGFPDAEETGFPGLSTGEAAESGSSGDVPGHPDDGRVYDGVVALYRFDEGAGALIQDRSLVAPPLHLTIPGGAPIAWLPAGGVQFQAAGSVATAGGANKVAQACRTTNELTLEAWITPASAKSTVLGPARILTYSSDTAHRNFTLGQVGSAYSLRVRTSNTDDNGIYLDADPVTGGAASTSLTHLVVTYSAASAQLYQGGALQTSATIGGGFEGWTDGFALLMGDEATGDRAWLGSLHLAAIYCRALTAAEVSQNFNAGA